MPVQELFSVSADQLAAGITYDERIGEGDYVLIYAPVRVNTYRGAIGAPWTVTNQELIQDLANQLYERLYQQGFPFVYSFTDQYGTWDTIPYWTDDQGIWLLAQKRIGPLVVLAIVSSLVILGVGVSFLIPMYYVSRIVVQVGEAALSLVSEAADAVKRFAGTTPGKIVGGFVGIAAVAVAVFLGYEFFIKET